MGGRTPSCEMIASCPGPGPYGRPGSHVHWHTVESSRSSGGLTPFTVPVTATDLDSDSDSYEICGVTQAASESTWLDTDTSLRVSLPVGPGRDPSRDSGQY